MYKMWTAFLRVCVYQTLPWSVLKTPRRLILYRRTPTFFTILPDPSGSAFTRLTKVSESMLPNFRNIKTLIVFPISSRITKFCPVPLFLDEGEWKWIDNSVLDYTNWQKDMPQSDLCVELNSESGQWSTKRCYRSRSYICKRAKSMSFKLSCSFESIHRPLVLTICSFFQLSSQQKSHQLLVS